MAGIDLSPDMVERLRQKPGGADIDVGIGDFAVTRVAGDFSLVALVFNTINNLTTQDAQVACFRNAAAHLDLGGRFVIDVAFRPFAISRPVNTSERSVPTLGMPVLRNTPTSSSRRSRRTTITCVRIGSVWSRYRSVSGRPSSTSWRSLRGCGRSNDGKTSADPRSPATRPATSRSGSAPSDHGPARGCRRLARRHDNGASAASSMSRHCRGCPG